MPNKSLPNKMPETDELAFKKIEGYNLEVGTALKKPRRIRIFRAKPFDTVLHIENTNILILGRTAEQELYRMITDHGRPTVQKLIPDGISGSTYTSIRKHFGLIRS